MARPRTFDEDSVLDAAIVGFWEHGFEAMSIRDLAARMGLSGPSLYNAFGDKRTLFSRALARYAEHSMRVRIAELEKNHAPAEAIARFLGSIVDRSVDDPHRRGCLIVNSALELAPHDPVLAAEIGGYIAEIRAFFLRSVVAGQKTGTIPDTLDPEDTASLLLGVLLGIRVLARVTPDRHLLEGVARPALDLLHVHRRPTGHA